MPNGNQNVINESARALDLASARLGVGAIPEENEDEKEGISEGEEKSVSRVNTFEAGIMLTLALVNDILDYFIIGSIPVIGDIFDGITWGVIVLWATFRGFKRPPLWGLYGVAELVPFIGDLIPTYTGMVLFIVLYNRRR